MLQNLINWTNVPKAVKNNFSCCKQILLVSITNTHCFCGYEVFGIDSQNDDPKRFMFPKNFATAFLSDKEAYLKWILGKFVDKFALGFINEY